MLFGSPRSIQAWRLGSFGLLALLFCVFLLSGCGSEGENKNTATPGSGTTAHLLKELEDQVSRAKKHINDYAPETEEVKARANEELEKLFAIEYRTIELSPQSTSADWTHELNVLGKDRWECESPLILDTTIRLICRRRPQSYLRGVGRFVGAF